MNAQQHREIEKLYFELYEQLLAYARCSLKNEALAEEAVQETFRIACAKPNQLCESSNPQGWLYNTLRFVIQNAIHTQERAKRLLNEYLTKQLNLQPCCEDVTVPEVLYENLADSKEFQLLHRFAIEKKSVLELAQEQNITVDACKKRLQRAKETLQRKIKK